MSNPTSIADDKNTVSTTSKLPLSDTSFPRNPVACIGTLIPVSLPSSALRNLLYSISDSLFSNQQNSSSSPTTNNIDKRISVLQSYIPSIIKELQSSSLQSYKQSNPNDYLRILTVIIAAYTRGKGTGKPGKNLLSILYPSILSLVPLMNYTELAVISEAYTHLDRKNILEHTLVVPDTSSSSSLLLPSTSTPINTTVENTPSPSPPLQPSFSSSSTFTQAQRTEQTKERSRLIASSLSTYPITGYDQERVYRAIHQRTLQLLTVSPLLPTELTQSSFYTSSTVSMISTVLSQTKKHKFTPEQVQELRLLTLFTSHDNMDALIRILLTISRTPIPCIDILDKVIPLIIVYLQHLPLGEKATHCLVRIMGTYSRTDPSLGALLDPLAERLNKELKYAMKIVIEKEEDEALHKFSGKKGTKNQHSPKNLYSSTVSDVDGIRRRLQPLIGAVWHLAIATQFQQHTDTLLRGVRFINHACGIGIRLSQTISSSSSSSGTKKINSSKDNKGGKAMSSSLARETGTSVRSLRLNTSDIGRLAAIQLGIEAFRIQQRIRQQARETVTVKNDNEITGTNEPQNLVTDESTDDNKDASPSQFIPNLHRSILPAINGWHKLNQIRLQTSSLQLSVRRSIVELCNKTRLPTPSIEKPIDQGLIIDFGWKLHDTAIKDDVPLVQQYPIGVAVEVDGPRHYVPEMESTSAATVPLKGTDNPSLYSPSSLDGPTIYKYWLLESFGWQVIHIPYQEWSTLEGNSSSLPKQQYLLNRLRETPLKNSIRL